MILRTENSKVEVSLVAAFFLSLCLLFYLEDRDLTAIELSSDQWNFLPITMKMANPNLFQTDLFMSDMSDMEYYTPWFIKPLYFFSWLNGNDPLQGVNTFHLVVQLLYCLCWFVLLRSLISNVWIVAIVTLLVRGIMWPPGNELWGIAGAWTLLPRTVYTALLPIPVLLLFRSLTKDYAKKEYLLAAFILGLIGNIHAISGLVCGLALILTYTIHTVLYGSRHLSQNIKYLLLAGLFFMLGLSPFIVTYLTSVVGKTVSDPELFSQLLPVRIGDQFLSPFGVFEKLKQLKWILLLLSPLLLSVFFGKRLQPVFRQFSRLLVILFLSILSISVLIVPVEWLLNELLGLRLKVAFQLVRGVKYLILPSLLLYGIWINHLFSFLLKVRKRSEIRIVGSGLFILFVVILFVSRSFSSSIPLLSDDLIRGQLPDNITRNSYDKPEDDGLLAAMGWIRNNTEAQASFVGPSLLRVGALRSVIHDFKGGSMLIEGNPVKYIDWALREEELDKMITLQQQVEAYRQWGAQYVLTSDDSEITYPLIKQFDKWRLYEVGTQ